MITESCVGMPACQGLAVGESTTVHICFSSYT
jgi:hypothetical protein